MAFYQDQGKKTRVQKRQSAEARGGFEDEGTRYAGDKPAKGAPPRKQSGTAPARGKAAPRKQEDAAPARGKQTPPGRKTGTAKSGDYRFVTATPQRVTDRGAATKPRPYSEQRQARQGESARPVARPVRTSESYRYEAPPAYDAPSSRESADIVPNENLLSGRNPIREALKSGRDIEKLLVARGELSGSAREIVQMAKEKHVPVQEVDRARLDAITHNHQGMLAFASAYQYRTVEDMLALAKEKKEAPLLVLLDGITDPHNLGAIIRSAECAGAHGVIVQERRAVGLTPAAVKASAGAVEYLPVARVINLTTTIKALQKQNIWVYAADMEGEDYTKTDLTGPVALVIGAEGEGVSRLVLEACDKRVSLPIRGQVESLNASVSAGILLYAAMRAR